MNCSRLRSVFALVVSTLFLTPLSHALPPQSNHAILQAVPAPGHVTIDGRLGPEEWDRSAGMYVYSSRQLRDRYAVRVYAMWDREHLYLGLDWQDPTPMYNRVDAQANPATGEIDRLLGGEGELQTAMGLSADAWFNAVSQVGNYDEIYARNLVPVGLTREGSLNASFLDGGLIYAPPAR